MKARFWFVVACAGWPVVVALGTPTDAFTTMGPADAFNGNAGYVLNYYSIATPFTNGSSAQLSSIQLGLTQTQPGNSLQLQVSLRPDAGGVPGNSPLEVWSLSSAPLSGSTAPLTVFESNLHPTLAQGAVYWIVEEVVSSTHDHRFGIANFNTQNIEGPVLAQLYYAGSDPTDHDPIHRGQWTPLSGQVLPAVQVNVNAVPEPGSAIILAAGLVVLVLVGRRAAGQATR